MVRLLVLALLLVVLLVEIRPADSELGDGGLLAQAFRPVLRLLLLSCVCVVTPLHSLVLLL